MDINGRIISAKEGELDILVCRMLSIDSEEYPETRKLVDSFINLPPDKQDYDILADQVVNADKLKPMPEEAADFVIADYKYAVADGKAEAANDLGALYYSGRIGGEPDYEKAREYYEIAEKSGYILAAENLAYIYYYGFGTDINYEKAYLYFSKAALAGRYESMYKSGDMFRYGLYVDKDYGMTAFCYRRALELIRNDNTAENNYYGCVYHRMGDLFYEGIGVEKNDTQAFRYYQLAEGFYYEQIEKGDKYHFEQLKTVIERQKKLRKKIQKSLPEFEF